MTAVGTSGSLNAEAFGRVLREHRVRAGRTQQQLADTLRVKRATLSQWETGRHLPSPGKVDHLDTLLGARRALVELAASIRGEVDDEVAAPVAPTPTTLRDVYQALGRAIVDNLVVDGNGSPQGWTRDFRRDLGVTPLSSAYAIKTLALIDAPYVDPHALGTWLHGAQERGGGWTSRGSGPRPEATAVVIDALSHIGGPKPLGPSLDVLESLTSGPARANTFILTSVLEVLARMRPDSAFTRRTVRDLLALRQAEGTLGVWPEKTSGAVGGRPRPSAAHTARAVIALRILRATGAATDADEVDEAVAAGTQWLLSGSHDDVIRENLEPKDEHGRVRDLEIRHFTPALVARALCLVEDPPWPRIQVLLDSLWSFYDAGLGLFVWPNGDVPIWLQYDAVTATRLAAERHAIVPQPRAVPDQQP
ncbi:helix-turn-helix domain-containing protein [Actinomycetospora aeridis]|uniref:Helix-turn-helix transcriptional regulator n=1 Tax=Actinomycetospora aeridis TaxID=3129231 RepID=A0ABU8NA33_9PSEU